MKKWRAFLFSLCLAALLCAAALHTAPRATVQALSEAEVSQPAAPAQNHVEPPCFPGACTAPVFWDTAPRSASVTILASGEEVIVPGPDDRVRIIIQLKADPVAEYRRQLRASRAHLTHAEQEQVRAYSSALHQKHGQLLQQATAAGITLQVRRQYTFIFNGLAASTKMADMERIAALPGVRGVHPDYEVCAALENSVPLIGADQVWEMRDPAGRPVTGLDMRVAVIDTGIDYTHLDLGGGFGPGYKVVGGYDFANNDADPMDDDGHGTHVAGIVAANGAVKGVAPDASLYAYKSLDEEGHGPSSDVIAALERATDPDGDPATDDAVDVINLSLGGRGSPDDPMSLAVDAVVNQGVVVAVSVGNTG